MGERKDGVVGEGYHRQNERYTLSMPGRHPFQALGRGQEAVPLWDTTFLLQRNIHCFLFISLLCGTESRPSAVSFYLSEKFAPTKLGN